LRCCFSKNNRATGSRPVQLQTKMLFTPYLQRILSIRIWDSWSTSSFRLYVYHFARIYPSHVSCVSLFQLPWFNHANNIRQIL